MRGETGQGAAAAPASVEPMSCCACSAVISLAILLGWFSVSSISAVLIYIYSSNLNIVSVCKSYI